MTTIHEALATLKMLGKRIERKITDGTYIAACEGDTVKGVDLVEAMNAMQADFQSVNDLIDYRRKLKADVIKSNAVTEVLLGGEVMTVAEVIDLKSMLPYKKQLLGALKEEYANAVTLIQHRNRDLEGRYTTFLSDTFKDGVDPELEKGIRKDWYARNEWKLADPNDLRNQIEALESWIEEFEKNVDFVLAESNTVTRI